MNFDTNSFEEFVKVNDLSSSQALYILIDELERLHNIREVE